MNANTKTWRFFLIRIYAVKAAIIKRDPRFLALPGEFSANDAGFRYFLRI
jgi:hypothetical protein